MIVCADIGNSEIMIGGFEGDELEFTLCLSADDKATSDEYALKINSALSLYGVDRAAVTGAIVASVVPHLTAVIVNAISALFGIETMTVGPGIKTGIGIRCDTPSSVGADLICSAVAAHYLFGSPSLIVDVGTATKITAVDEKGAFCGVSIIPGVMMGLSALSSYAAQLPEVSLERPGGVIAKNTADAMRSGVIYGHASMLDGMIDRIFKELGRELPVIATGSLAYSVLPFCSHEMDYDEHLVLRGLNILYTKNN